MAIVYHRIEAIATLADLEETSESTLRSLVAFILNKCDELIENEKQQPSNPSPVSGADDSSQKKPPSRGPTFNLNAVNIYARQIRQSIAELEPLHSIFSPLQSREQRMRFAINYTYYFVLQITVIFHGCDFLTQLVYTHQFFYLKKI